MYNFSTLTNKNTLKFKKIYYFVTKNKSRKFYFREQREIEYKPMGFFFKTIVKHIQKLNLTNIKTRLVMFKVPINL